MYWQLSIPQTLLPQYTTVGLASLYDDREMCRQRIASPQTAKVLPYTAALPPGKATHGCEGSIADSFVRQVYTINNESQHMMICGVPKLHLAEEVKQLVYPYGDTKKIELVPEYPGEEFTDTYHVQYARIQSARIAKRFIDGKNFYGGSLHAFYAPELESIAETRAKLAQRRRDVGVRIKRNLQDSKNPNLDKFVPKEQYHRRKKTPALPLTDERLARNYPGETMRSIYNGIPQSIDPRPVCEPSLPTSSYTVQTGPRESQMPQAPYHPAETIITAGTSKDVEFNTPNSENKRKFRNYKGQPIDGGKKVRVIRPQVIDTSTIVKWDTVDKKVFHKPKKIESNLTIKLLPRNDDKKKIIIKNPSVTQLVQPSKDLQQSIQSAKSQIRAAMKTQNSSAP